MSIKEKIIQEQIELNEKWLEKRKIGLIKYILFGGIRCFLFIGTSMLIYSYIEHRFSYNAITATIIASIIIPIISWFGNELRLKLFSK
jgi:uncharacterized membrane protein YqjE